MMRAVRYDGYGDVDVLRVEQVEDVGPGSGHVVVEVVSTSINPGEASIRTGALADRFPSTFPSGQGSDLAGRVVALADGVDRFAVGDEVFGWTDERAAQADLVAVPTEQLAAKPAGVSWEIAGSLYVAGATAWAEIEAVGLSAGQTVVVTAASGGVGAIATQLAVLRGAQVIAVAGPANEQFLTELGARFVPYGDGLRDRLRDAAPDGIDAFVDNFGGGYVEMALDLGVAKERINTVIDFAAVEKYGVRSEGNAQGARIEVLERLAALVEAGSLRVPIAATYPLEQVREAYTELERRHTRGKIVLQLR